MRVQRGTPVAIRLLHGWPQWFIQAVIASQAEPPQRAIATHQGFQLDAATRHAHAFPCRQEPMKGHRHVMMGGICKIRNDACINKVLPATTEGREYLSTWFSCEPRSTRPTSILRVAMASG